MAVTDQLARLPARCRESEAHHHVVKAALEQREQVLTGDAGLARSLLVVAVELLLEHPVVATCLLLLAQLQAVLALLLATATVLSGRVGASLDAALVSQAALTLEEQLLSLATALLALWACVSCHFGPSSLRSSCLDAPALARATSVVGLRGYILDSGHLEAGGLQ